MWAQWLHHPLPSQGSPHKGGGNQIEYFCLCYSLSVTLVTSVTLKIIYIFATHDNGSTIAPVTPQTCLLSLQKSRCSCAHDHLHHAFWAC